MNVRSEKNEKNELLDEDLKFSLDPSFWFDTIELRLTLQ
jgi:hypothetical protein